MSPEMRESKMRKLLRNKHLLVVLAVYGALAGVLLFGQESFPDEFPATDFELKDIMGSNEKVGYWAENGNPSIIYFFASW